MLGRLGPATVVPARLGTCQRHVGEIIDEMVRAILAHELRRHGDFGITGAPGVGDRVELAHVG